MAALLLYDQCKMYVGVEPVLDRADRPPGIAEELSAMRICSWSWLALVLSSLALPALAQTQPANTVRTLLAAGHLGSVVDTPLHFRLFAVRLPVMEHVSYSGQNSMLYVLSGTLTVALDG